MADPVAWTVVERGWQVFDAEGEKVGRVNEITGDHNADIFDGITITRGGALSSPRYVPSEHVAQILSGEVHLSLSRVEVEKLASYTEPIAEEILPETASWWERLASWWQRLFRR
jgi:uncharacterized protein YrrD